ncbi:hypothetical protein AYI69_g699 [Smittium culicis]|uniref:Uncharacterized protein n=1 Tax=Smittium culicis TaxID=133412 RepID=A0A1R1YSA2_9FUNG|nr:hypothetical protein AYI69_g699 [Smittium culicis]
MVSTTATNEKNTKAQSKDIEEDHVYSKPDPGIDSDLKTTRKDRLNEIADIQNNFLNLINSESESMFEINATNKNLPDILTPNKKNFRFQNIANLELMSNKSSGLSKETNSLNDVGTDKIIFCPKRNFEDADNSDPSYYRPSRTVK